MTKRVLGIDCSTQSMTGVLLEADRVYRSHSISYAHDSRLRSFGIDTHSMVVPPRVKGEADQPPLLFLAALECLLEDLTEDLSDLQAINCAAQQHGHVYLANTDAFLQLKEASARSLSALFQDAFSYQLAPIWMTSNTAKAAEDIRAEVGASLLKRSGSDIPLRFTGAIIRRVYQQFPQAFHDTCRIHLLSSFLAAVLAAQAEAPIDWGNAAGTSLMNYREKQWDPVLIAATAGPSLAARLPPLSSPQQSVGTIAPWFSKRFHIPPECQILAGSGDNPQTKSLAAEDLLSLGTSFVYMLRSVVFHPQANAMYDGFGRPFSFVCRSNGALVWDRVRAETGVEDFSAAEVALKEMPIGQARVFWQAVDESFPPSANHPCRGAKGHLAYDYPGIVDSSLAMFFSAIHQIFPASNDVVFLCGGPSASKEIVRRVSAFLGRRVVVLGSVGAALGAAAVAAKLTFQSSISNFTQASESFLASDEDRKAAEKFSQTLTNHD